MNTNFQSKFKMGVSRQANFSDSVCYKIDCDCGNSDCAISMWMEYNKECNSIFLHMYQNTKFDSWRYSDNGFINMIKRIIYKWKQAIRLIFTGEISLEGELVLINLDHINSVIEALQEGRDYCIELQKIESDQIQTLKNINSKTLNM